MAIYTPATVADKEKRSTESNFHYRQHAAAPLHDLRSGHQHLHHRHSKVKEVRESQFSKRAVGDVVSATIDGQVVSWINVYSGPVGDTNARALEAVDSTSASTPHADTTELPDMTSQSSVASSTTTIGTSSSTSSTAAATSGDWARQAYFEAESGKIEGLTVLIHFGGEDGIPGTGAGTYISEYVFPVWLASLGDILPILHTFGGLAPLFCTKPWAARRSTQANTCSCSQTCFIDSLSRPLIKQC